VTDAKLLRRAQGDDESEPRGIVQNKGFTMPGRPDVLVIAAYYQRKQIAHATMEITLSSNFM